MNSDEIKKSIKELAERLTIPVDDISVSKDESSGHETYTIKTKESGLLIGQKGTGFSALSHLLRKIISKKFGIDEKDASKVSFDVNDYREKTKKELEQRAKIMADRAVSFKCDIEMEPMSSYERMCIHAFLKGYKDVKTESAGFGKERHLIIKYSPENEGDSKLI